MAASMPAVYKPAVTEPAPIPSSAVRAVGIASLLALLAAAGLTVGLPTLRQGRLLDEAADVCAARTAEAELWLAREPDVAARLDAERAEAQSLQAAFLSADDSGTIEPSLRLLAEQHGCVLTLLRLGTRREGSVLDTAPATAVFTGPRVALPELVDDFYRQGRIVRLVALDVDLPRFGEETVRTTLRWEYAAPSERPPSPDDPTLRWSPPVLLARSGPTLVDAWNRGRWERLERDALSLRSLAPRLRTLAAIDATRALLEDHQSAVAQWRDAQGAERGAVQRRLPELLRRVDLSADGRASLRPGTGGRLVVGDASGGPLQ